METKVLKVVMALICLIITVYGNEVFQKIIHNTDPQALCLDGSPAGLYFHQGKQKNKFLIFLQGGGACGGSSLSEILQDCYKRSKTAYGSTKLWAQTRSPQGCLSTDPTKNKYAEWTKVIFGYCDGSLHQGYTKTSFAYKDTQLYFRGNSIVRSHFSWLNSTYGLYNAEQIIFTGGSAGGIGTFIWTNYLQGLVSKPQSVFTIIDSGIFLIDATSKNGFVYPPTKSFSKKNLNIIKNLHQDAYQIKFSLSNRDQLTPFKRCNELYPKMEYYCLAFQNIYQLLQGPVLILNSQYDNYTIPYILNIDCLKDATVGGSTLTACNTTQITTIQNYRKRFNLLIQNFIQQSTKRSAWTISCSNHVYSPFDQFYNTPQQRVPMIQGYSVQDAIERFLKGQQVIRTDFAAWPGNRLCAY